MCKRQTMLSCKEVAARLGVSAVTVWRRAQDPEARKKLGAKKIGSQWRFDRVRVETWIRDETSEWL